MNSILSIVFWKIKAIISNKISFTSLIINSRIDKTSAVRNNVRAYYVKMGKYSYIARNTLIQNTTIGNFCSISEGCNIGMPSHPTSYLSTSPVFLKGNNYLHKNFSLINYNDCPKTIIANDVWIGTGAKIKSGIKVGNGAIIAAGAVVTKDIPEYAIVGGVPAKIIKYRFDKDTINKLNDLKWWDMNEGELIRLSEYADKVSSLIEYEE